MAKVMHTVKTFGSASNHISDTAAVTFGAHGTPNLKTDTIARSIFSVFLSVTVDDSVNPPPYDWFQSARCTFAVAWSPTGTTTLPSSENDQSLKGRVMLYPELWYPTPVNGLHGVLFKPRGDTIQFHTRHKGNGVNTGEYSFGLYLHDSSGVLQNPGGIYSVLHGWAWYATTMWESDT